MSDAKTMQNTPNKQRAGGRRNAPNKRNSSPASNASGSNGSQGGGSASVASAAAPNVEASNIIAEELRLRLAEVERRERDLNKREAQLAHGAPQKAGGHLVQALGTAGPSSPVVAENAVAVREEVRISAVQPPELTYVSASKGSALEDWLFKLDQLFTQTRRPETEWQERIRVAKLHWDRHMFLWWSGCVKAAEETKAPIASWSAFVFALRRQFVPAGDAEAARSDLLRLRLGGGESMDAYLQRAVLLMARAGEFVDDKMAGVLLIEGVDSSRFPFTVQSVRRRLREAGVSGLSFAQVRAELSTEAHSEPSLHLAGRGAGGAHAAASGDYNRSKKFGSTGGAGASSKQLRINALRKKLQALETTGEEDEDSASDETGKVNIAPVGAKSGGPNRNCHKCGGEGHIARECTSKKELRKCFLCEKVGHVRPDCPDKKRQEGAASAGTQSKN